MTDDTAERQQQPPWKEHAEAVAAAHDTDVLIFNGGISRWWDRALIDGCRNRRRRPNVLLLLVTSGGDADAGYRMARCLQRYYTRVTVFISGYCKSAGTLVAIGAHELVVADHGELGPLDVQMQKADELWETSSGLTVMEAISTLEETAYKMLEDGFIRIKGGSGGQITFKTASEIAVELVQGALKPIYEQVDPMHVGEAGRAMKIARDYGERLNNVAQNLKAQALVELVNGYSSHGFVLDREEAGRLFERVREPLQEEDALADNLGDAARVPSEQTMWGFLNDEPPQEPEGETHDAAAGAPIEVDDRENGRGEETLQGAERDPEGEPLGAGAAVTNGDQQQAE